MKKGLVIFTTLLTLACLLTACKGRTDNDTTSNPGMITSESAMTSAATGASTSDEIIDDTGDTTDNGSDVTGNGSNTDTTQPSSITPRNADVSTPMA